MVLSATCQSSPPRSGAWGHPQAISVFPSHCPHGGPVPHLTSQPLGDFIPWMRSIPNHAPIFFVTLSSEATPTRPSRITRSSSLSQPPFPNLPSISLSTPLSTTFSLPGPPDPWCVPVCNPSAPLYPASTAWPFIPTILLTISETCFSIFSSLAPIWHNLNARCAQ